MNLIDKVFAEVDYRISIVDRSSLPADALKLVYMAQGAMAFVRGQILQGFVHPTEAQTNRWEEYENKLIELERQYK